jgi:predicted O-methyltransferase YrrM
MNELDIWKRLYEFRGGSHGHLPLNDDVVEFFKNVSDLIKPTNILEFGTNLGGSAALQLTLNTQANLTSFDPTIWKLSSGSVNNSYINQRSIFKNVPAVSILELVFGSRFTFVNRSSTWVQSLVTDKFDYVFIDGSHRFRDVQVDIQNCIEMGIPYLLIDNISADDNASKVRLEVKEAVDTFSHKLTVVDSLKYEIVHRRTQAITNDYLILYKVKD